MDEDKSAINYSGNAFKVIFGLLVVLMITQTPLGGILSKASAGIYTSTVSLLRTNTGGFTLDDGLVGHWTFDGDYMDLSSSTGEVLDRSGNANIGNWLNHATTTVKGKSGQAIDFDGVDDYVDAGDIDAMDLAAELTISAWMRRKNVGSPVVISKGAATNNRTGINLYTDGNLYFNVSYGGISYGQKNSVNDTEWHYYTLIFDGSGTGNSERLRGFMDGEEISLTYNATVPATTANLSSPLEIGFNDANSDQYSEGYVDDVRVYDRALSAKEVQSLYDSTAGNKIATTITTNDSLENGLVNHWTFDGEYMDIESSTQEVLDRGSGNDKGNWTHTSTSTSAGKVGQAIDFDGSGDNVNFGDLGHLDSMSAVSICAWVKLESDDVTADHNIISKWNGFGWWLQIDDVGSVTGRTNTVSFSVNTNQGANGRVEGSTDLVEPGEWSHYCGTYQASSFIRLYKNGVLDTENTTTIVGNSYFSAYSVMIGEHHNGTDDFDGLIDDVRVYDRALSADEAKRLYQMGGGTKVADTATPVGGLASGLVGHWTFDGPDINIPSTTAEITDISGNGNHGDANSSVVTDSVTIGVLGQAITVEGTNYITVSQLDDVNFPTSGALSFWFKGKIPGGSTPGIFDQYQASLRNHIFIRGTDEDVIQFAFQDDDGGSYEAGYNSNDTDSSVWSHFVVVWDTVNDKGYVYKDGVLKDEDTITDPTWVPDGQLVNFKGAHPGTSLDDVRLYNRPITATEVIQLYGLGR